MVKSKGIPSFTGLRQSPAHTTSHKPFKEWLEYWKPLYWKPSFKKYKIFLRGFVRHFGVNSIMNYTKKYKHSTDIFTSIYILAVMKTYGLKR